ncbi:unnamed protein product [Pieris macdunnoughi]|uniref:Histone-lysine N-methyltransferase ash1 n=1 Tax=Pieris macdunnoughi TaxID=345717 RepID=A0A821QJ00_9NEOP|nr:unnamed protein product [Pieris macdunnoughi]
MLRVNSSDPFAPGPVFSGLQRPVTTYNIFKVSHNNNNTLLKPPGQSKASSGTLLPLKPVFTHKFGVSPLTSTKQSHKEVDKINSRNLSPRNRKQAKFALTAPLPTPKKEHLKPLPNIFEKAKNCYVPNKSLSRNVFLSFKKSDIKPTYHIKKHRRTVVLAPPKINLKPTERPSRITIKTESKHHRHRSKRRHRSRSVSRCRESANRNVAETIDQKFNTDMDNLINNFIKLCQVAPKLLTNVGLNSPKHVEKEKPPSETAAAKVVKRTSKKRKTSDNLETATPTSKRRHKKQLAESQNKGKDTNEHKLPLKKRHYHINSSTSNSLSLSLVTSEFDENLKNEAGSEKFLCTESDCLVDLQTQDSEDSPKSKSVSEKSKRPGESLKIVTASESKIISDSLPKEIKTDGDTKNIIIKNDESNSPVLDDSASNSINITDDDLLIKKPSAEQSELSKKIYETSEKLKAVHKMVHDLEKSLPKTKDVDVKPESSKLDSSRISSPRSETKSSPMRNPIVTPKKRHRLEAEKDASHSNLNNVVQSLSKKISEEKPLISDKKDINENTSQEDIKDGDKTTSPSPNTTSVPASGTGTDPLKSMSARSLYKSAIPPAQKSEIMTRKKNRLEGLTSNLVSKINPSAATKVLDTLLNNNIRKSIESRILEKEKSNSDSSCSNKSDDKIRGKDSPNNQINTRASVIKSPVSKGKLLETKCKTRISDSLSGNTVVVNVDNPTGIFESSVDLEDQIPKSSICVSNILAEKNKKLKNHDSKSSILSSIDTESDLPLSLIAESSDSILRPKRGESIAAVISDKIQETAGGHNLRQPKRNLMTDSDDANEKKKKKTSNNIIRESKLVLPSKILIPKVQAERMLIGNIIKKSHLQIKKSEQTAEEPNDPIKTIDPVKKKPRRRKAFNRTGFPNVKRKKKKVEYNNSANSSHDQLGSEDTDSSAFERVPKDGEAMSNFLERTTNKQPELKIVLNKEECPKQGRLTVVALEKLQGREALNKPNKQGDKAVPEKKTSSILRAPALQLKQKTDKEIKNHVNKWEVLSETDSIPSLASSLGNDPEDSIPLSLLNLKQKANRVENIERLKRKSRVLSPSNEIEQIFSKRKVVEKTCKVGLRPKSSLAVLYPSERRHTRSFDNTAEDGKIKTRKSENKKVLEVTEKEKNKPMGIITRRKSRSCQLNKKVANDVVNSSRESSLETIVSRKMPPSREPSIDTLLDHDENEPLPLNEKEIDFEKSIDVISKNIICKKRAAASRDGSPSNGVDSKERIVSKKNPRLRKKFLLAGLFSEYYKEDPKPEGKGKNLITQTEFPPGLLGPPPYCERWVRKRLIHFTLPYDIWWEQHYNQPVPSWNYKKIRTTEECESDLINMHHNARRQKKKKKKKKYSGCNEDCINRLVYSECSPQLCPSGDKCKNQRIQRHEWASGLEKFMTENKGWGVRTKHRITSGDFILEYVGEVVSDKEFKERMATRYARDTHHYCLHLDGGLVIDGHRMGGDGRFVNHSCRPNCEMQKWTSNGTFRMALFALRDIDPDEELTYDYNFSLFNPAVGQPCKCDSEDCRGVIGGKSQRITKQPLKTQSRTPSNASNQSSTSNQPRVGRPRKAVKCNKKSDQLNESACDIKNMTILKYQQHLNKLWQEPQLKPLTAKERTLVKDRHCFLFRNLENVRRTREKITLPMPPSPVSNVPSVSLPPVPEVINVDPLALPDTMNPQVFHKKLQNLRASKDEILKLAKFEDDSTLDRKQRLGRVFKALFTILTTFKGDEDKPICTPLLKLKNQKSDSISDLNGIQNKIDNNDYESIVQFDSDVSGLMSMLMREYSKATAVGSAAAQLKKVYTTAKLEFAEHLSKILGSQESLPSGFIQKTKPEEVILCICGLHVEEGLMVQCGNSRCGVWQHARCMRLADTSSTHYCHLCSTEPVDREIPLDEYTEEGHQFYLSLMRDGLQVRQGDTVYVLRDIPINDKHPDVSQKTGDKTDSPKTKRVDRKKLKNIKGKEKEDITVNKDNEVRKHTYQTIGCVPVSELDIFRVERLWKHKDTQERYVYGHHYLRPHETFHEPTRKFFHNEVMRVPLYEAVPIELVMSQCWVMDLNTFCKGRPVGASEAHVYICELRVDRTAHLFTKVSRPKYPLCTKPYAFDHFPQRLKISRTYAPHEVLPEYLKGRAGKNFLATDKPKATNEIKKKPSTSAISSVSKALSPAQRREQQKERVNEIARGLLTRGGQRGAVDASYLLAPRVARRPRARLS